jgi:iron complex outermembrane receptor protein
MKTTKSHMIWLVLLLVNVLIGSPIAHSQSGLTLTGKIVDESGAGVSGALVGLYSTKRSGETKADSGGGFEFSNLDPGKYQMEVTSPGFNKVTKEIEIRNKTPRPLFQDTCGSRRRT